MVAGQKWRAAGLLEASRTCRASASDHCAGVSQQTAHVGWVVLRITAWRSRHSSREVAARAAPRARRLHALADDAAAEVGERVARRSVAASVISLLTVMP